MGSTLFIPIMLTMLVEKLLYLARPHRHLVRCPQNIDGEESDQSGRIIT